MQPVYALDLGVMNLKASDDEIRRFVGPLDLNRDGHVSFEEFRNFMLLLPPTNARAAFDTCRDIHVHPAFQRGILAAVGLRAARLPSQLHGALALLLSPVCAQLVGVVIAFNIHFACALILHSHTCAPRGAVAGAARIRTGTAPLSLIVARSQLYPAVV